MDSLSDSVFPTWSSSSIETSHLVGGIPDPPTYADIFCVHSHHETCALFAISIASEGDV